MTALTWFSCISQSAVSYIHRIGRTGRGGRKGEAVTFFTEDDMIYLRTIANVMKLSGCEVPDWMLSLKKVRYVAGILVTVVAMPSALAN